ncbi:hypothetical protein OPV22_000488 [Ensete ventricosum]|uniref:HIRAN domain-containing protein n=1 Tax=Ensete ventricosum TaxID=4639 RepID=A0AAV8RVJ9_ENSVE|nr:hypothetical protein OPV22_000488 [Ensete ventricosum]
MLYIHLRSTRVGFVPSALVVSYRGRSLILILLSFTSRTPLSRLCWIATSGRRIAIQRRRSAKKSVPELQLEREGES